MPGSSHESSGKVNSPQRRRSHDATKDKDAHASIDHSMLMESEDTLATKIDSCTRRESELRKQIDQDSEEKAVVGQKVKFVQIELNQIQQEFTSLDEHISHSEEELKSLKWHQVDIWDQQQSSDTLIQQKSHKDWLLVEQKQAKVDAEQQLYLVEQQVLQSVANDLQEEKLEIEVKRDEVRREVGSMFMKLFYFHNKFFH